MFNLYTLGHFGKLETLTTLFNVLFPIVTIAVVVGLLFLLKFASKTQLGKKIVKLCLAGTLIALYLTKMIFWIVRATGVYAAEEGGFNIAYILNTFGLDLNFWLVIITAFVLIYTAVCKKQCRWLEVLKQTMLGVAIPLAFVSLINPRLIIDINDPWTHCVNLCPIITNMLLMLCPLYFVAIKETQFSLNKFWKAICGYICISSLSMIIALILNRNISGLLAMPNSHLIVKMKIAFPWYLLIVIPAFLAISFGLYALCWYLIKLINKNKEVQPQEDENQEQQVPQKNEYFDLYSFATKSIACMQGFLILIILAVIVRAPNNGTFLGLFCLLPLVMTIFCILAVFEMDKLAEENNEEIFNKGNPKAKKFLTYSFIGNPLFGLVILKQYINERNSIQERIVREEKKRLREQQRLEQERLAAEQAEQEKPKTTKKKSSTTQKKSTTTRKKKTEEPKVEETQE
ncbi:MAG: hypothetical protein J6Q51_00890 [Clostridia bacterium]|nr:hypothetical protein [Clostridia bacterium]